MSPAAYSYSCITNLIARQRLITLSNCIALALASFSEDGMSSPGGEQGASKESGGALTESGAESACTDHTTSTRRKYTT